MTDAIVTDRLTKHYHGRRVVDSLSLRVPAGSVYGLLGRNGAGKSTAIKMLMGMVRPDSGTATLMGEEIGRLSEATRARIAYLAEGHPLYGWMTVGQAVEFTRAFYPRWNGPLVEQILDHFGLRASNGIGGSRAASRRRSRWPWRWARTRSCWCSTTRRWEWTRWCGGIFWNR